MDGQDQLFQKALYIGQSIEYKNTYRQDTRNEEGSYWEDGAIGSKGSIGRE